MFSLSSLFAYGDTNAYDAGWSRVQKALSDDLPQTALKELSALQKQALTEGNMPQLCRVLFQTMQCKTEISPDSLQPSLDAIQAALDAEQRPVQRAVYQHLLGICKNDTALIHASLADLNLLANAKATDYLPLINRGKDSQWLYGDDLLSLFVADLNEHHDNAIISAAQHLYEERGNKAAALLLMQRQDLPDSTLYPVWRKAVDEDASLRRVSPIMTYLAAQEQPSLSLSIPQDYVIYPGESVTFVAHARNIREASLQVAGQTHRLHFPDTPVWEERTDTIRLSIPKPGVYEVQLSAEGLSDTEKINVSSVKPLFFGLPDGRCRVVLVDAATGEKLSDSRLVRRNRKTETVFRPEADGYIYLMDKDYNGNNYSADFFPQAGKDTFHPAVKRWSFVRGYYADEREINSDLVHIFTDRNIYRPGQEVQVALLSYKRHDDDYAVVPHDSLTVKLRNDNGEELSSVSLVTDDLGEATTTFRLPKVCMPGYFSVIVYRGKSYEANESFRVEEYKRPTFEVKIDAFTEEFALGDTAVVCGSVKTYSGIPLTDTEVTSSLGDTVRTDDDGRFSFPVKVEHTEGMWWRWWGMTVEVSVTGSNGETATASTRIPIRHTANEEKEQVDKHTLPFWREESRSTDGSEASLTIGSCHKPCHVFLDVLAGKKIVESRIVTFTDSFTYNLKYRPEWGDGAVAHLAFVHSGELHTAAIEVRRPEPDKRLLLHWSTFRSELQPGQDEEWALQVLRPDGSPAQSLVTARLYDAALDAFTDNNWNFGLDFRRNIPSSTWRESEWDFPGIFLAAKMPQYRALDFTVWQNGLFRYYGSSRRNIRVRGTGVLNEVMLKSAPMAMATADMASAKERTVEEAAMIDNGEAHVPTTPQIRENFDETAFFMPALRTDGEGKVGIRFRLPESLTSWKFTAYAHDALLNYGILNDTIVARKTLMAEINAPRFLRDGDETLIPVTFTNMADKAQNCTLTFWRNDAAETQPLTLAAGERRTILFPYKVEAHEGGYLTLKATISSDEFADGEERIVPLLTNMVEVTHSVPYSLTKRGERTIDLTPLWRELNDAQRVTFSTEQCSNPAWYVVNALNPIFDERAESAASWGLRFYALQLAQYVKKYVPSLTAMLNDSTLQNAVSTEDSNPFTRNADLRQTLLDESPWIVAAKTESERQATLAENLDEDALKANIGLALSALEKQQKNSGAWPWYNGMEESVWTTTHIATLLARQHILTGGNAQASRMLEKSLPYLHKEMHKTVLEMKAYEKKYKTTLSLGEGHYRYLYLCAITDQNKSADMDYLLQKAQKANHDLTMYGKAGSAVILSYFGGAKRADLLLRSMLEHSVSTEEMGRYFDTDRALYGWSSYKIPTQTFAIEALQRLQSDKQAQAIAELRLWLLQSKRTQQWLTSEATAEAAYAVLAGQDNFLTPDVAGTGYTRTLVNVEKEEFASFAAAHNTLTVKNEQDHPLWGAAFVNYLLPATKVQGDANGLAVTRSLEVQRGKEWQPLAVGTTLKVGDRVRVNYTLRAERDMDFVSLKSSRAACMEPRKALSGYDWYGGYYRTVRDQRTDFFFEHLRKGTHEFTEEMVLDRAGTFTLGLATAECVYAPEYRSVTEDTTLVVAER